MVSPSTPAAKLTARRRRRRSGTSHGIVPAPRRDHHGRQRPLGAGARPLAPGRPPRRHREHPRASSRPSPSATCAYLTLFAFSTENWTRPRREVNAAAAPRRPRHRPRAARRCTRTTCACVHIGSLDPLPSDLQRRVRDAIELTKDNTGLTVCVAFNYGGRAEIVEAVKRIVADGVPPDEHRRGDVRALPQHAPACRTRTSSSARRARCASRTS